MQSTEDITRQLAALASKIEQLNRDEHGDVAMILFTVAASLGTKEGRERVTKLMLDVSGQLLACPSPVHMARS